MQRVRATDVLVIGAGQAGLAAGQQLAQTSLSYLIVDGAARVGDSWRRRWDSLTLFTPAAYSSLPGLALPGDPGAYPNKDAIADYLERYAEHFDLCVQLASRVTRLERHEGAFVALLESGTRLHARAVIVATGAFQTPAIPDLARPLSRDVAQYTPSTYRNPQTTVPGTVLVVGHGATGRQIALELSDARRVLLAAGRPRRATPERIAGRSLFWWLDKTGILRASRESRIGRLLREADAIPGKHLGLGRLASSGVGVKPRLTSAAGRIATFADGTQEEIDGVVWAAGHRDDSGWMKVAGALDADGRFIESKGRSPLSGLYYLGRKWQRTVGSALLLGVGDDARFVIEAVARELATEGRSPETGREDQAHPVVSRGPAPS